MVFTEKQFVKAVQTAVPGQALSLEDASSKQIDAALERFGKSTLRGSRRRARDFDMGAHVSVSTHWWGVRIEFDHEAVQAQEESFTVVNLTMAGVPLPVAGIIAASITMIAAQDRGNGVIAFVTWALVHWYLPR